jgi:hypothetical protein
VAESLLVVAYAELMPNDECLAAAVLAVVGVVLTASWVMVGHRHASNVKLIQERARKSLPEFEATRQAFPEIATWRRPHTLLVYVVPCLLLSTWLFLFVIAVD